MDLETLTTQEETPEAATTETLQAQPQAAQNGDSHMIPKARFDEVNEQLKALKTEQEKATKAAELANRKALEDQNNFKALYETEKAERERAAAEAQALQLSIIKRDVATTLNIPPGLINRISGNSQEEIEADAKALLEALPKPSAPNLDSRAGGGSAGKSRFTDDEIAEMAATMGVSSEYLKKSMEK